MNVDPHVTRWAPELRDAGRAAGLSGLDLTQFIGAGLAQIAHESGGNPTATNRNTGAYGLTQQMPRWYRDTWAKWSGGRENVREHLREYARNIAATWRRSGSLVSAVAAWAHGEAAVRAYVDTGRPQHDWVAKQRDGYIVPLWTRAYPAYAAWVSTWIAAGEPGDAGALATDPRRSGAPNPYTGEYVWGSKRVRVGSGEGIASGSERLSPGDATVKKALLATGAVVTAAGAALLFRVLR